MTLCFLLRANVSADMCLAVPQTNDADDVDDDDDDDNDDDDDDDDL